jgi:hypothetical protein
LKGLDLYQRYPDHIRVAEFISAIREERIAIDFDPDSP